MLVRDGRLEIRSYWTLDYTLEPILNRSDQDYLEEFEIY